MRGAVSRRIRQRTSHADLALDRTAEPTPSTRSRSGSLDAIIVPASRPASFLQSAIDLAATLDVLLVVLCSRQTKVEQVAQRVAATPRARALIIPVPVDWTHAHFPTRTSDPRFAGAKAGRDSDLSKKRNLGLLLARLHGWNKITFIDDDITLTKTDGIDRLAGQLDAYQVAGMVLREFPDNSVVCHARRLADPSQDVFVSGAVLGVHCNNLPLAFFPDIYNEDWFFFARDAAQRQLPGVGQAVQEEYDPFASPDRARWEEFGDLLAEGLFTLFGDWNPTAPFAELLGRAGRSYWSQFIEARTEVLDETEEDLGRLASSGFGDRPIYAALNSLAAARSQLNEKINADLCVEFVEAYREDLLRWQRQSSRVNNVGSTREAMDFLQLTTWRLAMFGAESVDDVRGARRITSLVTV